MRYGTLYRNQGTSFPGGLDPRPRGGEAREWARALTNFVGAHGGDEARLRHWATDAGPTIPDLPTAWQADRDPWAPLEAVKGVPTLGAKLLCASSAQAYVVLVIDPWAERRQSGFKPDPPGGLDRVPQNACGADVAAFAPASLPYSARARRERPSQSPSRFCGART